MNPEKDTILIADDSEISHRVITEVIKMSGANVKLFHAVDGKQACDMAEEILPDLILMDVIMPERNGIEAVKYLRDNECTANIPIIVLSATESLEPAYEAGANDFISKPFQRHELLIKVRSALHLVQTIKKIHSQKLELENKHKEVLSQRDQLIQHRKDILDDISYSKRIQKAILPGEEAMELAFKEYFILNLPRNIVSGDFYWLGELKDRKILAVADCTGHGVSGAFMTMAGTAFLNQILSSTSSYQVSTAAEILFELRELVMKLLKQKGEEGEASDGMDISLIMIEDNGKKLQFAGANNPLYIIHEGELNVVKGDRMPIGIHLNFNQPFTNHIIDIHSGDMLYMFTDGYADQFGGPHNKKFRYRQYQELLLSLYKWPLNKQKEALDRTMVDWMGKNDQVDDILVLGLRI